MKISAKSILIFGGWLMLAAFPVFAQTDELTEEITLNNSALAAFADFVIEKVEKDNVDLSRPFKVVFEGSLIRGSVNKDTGEELRPVVFDKVNSNWIDLSAEEAGDAEVGEIAKKAILAVGDSGFLGYFYSLGIKNINISFSQDSEKILVVLEMRQKSKERAMTIASGLTALLTVAKTQVKDGVELLLLESMRKTPPTSRVTYVIVNAEMEKDLAQEIIKTAMAENKSKRLREQK